LTLTPAAWRRFLPFLVFYATAGAACAQPQPACAEIGGITSELAEISGLKQVRPIDCESIARDQVRRFLEEHIKETVKPEEIRTQELVLKKFGLVPPDFDLKKTTVDLLSEQAAAFYDYRTKKLYVIGGAPEMAERTALVHELAHALADQHFGLKKFIDRTDKDDDATLARMAVMEGQATWLMTEYVARQTGRSLRDSPILLQIMVRASEMAASQYPVFQRAPLYLRETLVFPYTQGILFQNAVVEKLGQAAFSSVFRDPPVSTQQVLHPGKYFAGVRPAKPPLPEAKSLQGWRKLIEGDVGELDHSILLRQYVGKDEAAQVAPEWRGGRFRLFESPREARTALAYASEWSSPEAAARFFKLYQRVLQGKWKKLTVESESADTLAGRGDDGYFRLRLEGALVTSLEGLPSPAPASKPSENAIHWGL
jgi:hypothetical protein